MLYKILEFKIFHYYLIPLVALVVWWGMLIALLSCWYLQGKPIYDFMHGEAQDPVYISDIGATNLQPLFISCVGFQMFFFIGTLVTEFVLRMKRKLQPYISKIQPRFAIVSIVFGVIGQFGILFVAIFKTSKFKKVHLAMMCVFIVCEFFACLFNFFNSFIFGNRPERLHPIFKFVIFGKRRWQNLYIVSFGLKMIWLLIAFVLAVLFGYYMKIDERSKSAIFEWTIAFWYGMLLVFWSIDLLPSAVKSWDSQYAEKSSQEFVDNSRVLVTETRDDSHGLFLSSEQFSDHLAVQAPPPFHVHQQV